jgi:hypothetical protein
MTDAVRCWLVERTYSDRDLVTLVYATPDGERHLTKELSSSMLPRTTVTAAEDVEPGRLQPVDDPDLVERYATEAARVRDNNDPDEAI